MALWTSSASSSEVNMRVSAVRVVDYFDQSELPVPGAAGLDELLGRQAAEKTIEQISPNVEFVRPHRLLLRVEFTSTLDLRAAARDAAVSLHSYFCGRPKDFVVISGPAVYSNGEPIRPRNVHYGSGEGDLYYFFANVARKESPLSKPPQRSFDLRTKPEDICFYVAESGPLGVTYKSDVARVLATDIAAAFEATSSR